MIGIDLDELESRFWGRGIHPRDVLPHRIHQLDTDYIRDDYHAIGFAVVQGLIDSGLIEGGSLTAEDEAARAKLIDVYSQLGLPLPEAAKGVGQKVLEKPVVVLRRHSDETHPLVDLGLYMSMNFVVEAGEQARLFSISEHRKEQKRRLAGFMMDLIAEHDEEVTEDLQVIAASYGMSNRFVGAVGIRYDLVEEYISELCPKTHRGKAECTLEHNNYYNDLVSRLIATALDGLAVNRANHPDPFNIESGLDEQESAGRPAGGRYKVVPPEDWHW